MAVVGGCTVSALSAGGREGAELVGTRPPALEATDWVNSPPLSLDALRGRVVLVRWWTGPACPYCRASAHYLTDWHDRYAGRGLVVLGLYHHKSDEPLAPGAVPALARRYGFRFPVAVDPGWRTLRRWWLSGGERRFTSVSFLLDRNGVVRYVHPGGEYSARDAREIDSAIRTLLAEPGAARSARAER